MDIVELDQWCDRYEEALKSQGTLPIGDFLEKHSLPQDSQLIQELEAVRNAYLSSPTEAGGTATESFHRPEDSLLVGEGQTVGNYKLLQRIGEGGMGAVYMAEQVAPIVRRVAIKIIKPGMDSEEVIARFEAERQALSMMDHPNIARVLDAGATQTGKPYFVMELVKGVPITQFCDERRLSARERLELFVPVCQAVQHAHQKGIIHRDLKPSNILVSLYDDKAVPKIIDFGVAKAISQKLTERTVFTRLGQIVGTFAYMSPEQAQFNQLDVDTRSDIYSLGVVLYELLAGETPFDKKVLRKAALDELVRIIRHEEPPKPSHKLSSSEALPSIAASRNTDPLRLSRIIHGELDWIVMQALEKDRARRYETANAFAMDVLRFLADEPVAACPPSRAYQFRKFARRHGALLTTAATIAICLIAGIIGTSQQAYRAYKAETLATERFEGQKKATRMANRAAASALTANEKAHRRLYEMNVAAGLEANEKNRPYEALLWFAKAAELAEPGSPEEEACLVRHRSWRRITPSIANYFTHDGEDLKVMEFDPSGQYLATTTTKGVATVRATFGRGNVSLIEATVSDQAWHPQKILLAIANAEAQRVDLIEYPSGSRVASIDFDEPIGAIDFDPSGNLLAISGKTTRIYDFGEQEFRSYRFDHPMPVKSHQFSSDSKRLLTDCRDRGVRQWVLEESETQDPRPVFRRIGHYRGTAPEPTFLNRAEVFAVPSDSQFLWYSTKDGKAQVWGQGFTAVTGAVQSPDQKTFAISRQGFSYELWNTNDGKRRIQLGGEGGWCWGIHYSPDGLDLLLHANVNFSRSRASDGEPYGGISPKLGTIDHLAWSPDGRHIATANENGRTMVWRLNAFLPAYKHLGTVNLERNPRVTRPMPQPIPLDGLTTRLKQSDSGRLGLTCGRSPFSWLGELNEVKVIDLSDGRVIHTLRTTAPVLDAAISESEDRIAVATREKRILLWDLKTGSSQTCFTLEETPLQIEFLPDDEHIVVLSDAGTIRGFDTATGKQQWTCVHPSKESQPANRDSHLALHVSHDRTWFASRGPNKLVAMWNASDGSRKSPDFEAETRVLACCISDDGAYLAIGCRGSAVVVNTKDGAKKTLQFAGGAVRTLFDNSGKRLLVLTNYGKGLLWDWRLGKRICPPIQSGTLAAFAGNNDEWIVCKTESTGVRIVSSHTGKPVTPGWPARGPTIDLLVNNESSLAFLSGRTTEIEIFDLNSALMGPPIDADLQMKYAEVLSNASVASGEVVQLGGDFRKHVTDLRQSDPAFFETDWTSEEVTAWHFDQLKRAHDEQNWYAANWRAERLASRNALTGVDYRNEILLIQLSTTLETLENGKIQAAEEIYHTINTLDLADSRDPELLQLGQMVALKFSSLQQGNKNEIAAPLTQLVWQARKQLLGESDVDTLNSLSYLAKINVDMGRTDDAIAHRRELLNLFRQRDSNGSYSRFSAITTSVVELADLLTREKRHAESIDLYQKHLADSYRGRLQNNLAWLLVTCPDESLRDPERAVEVARSATEAAPQVASHFNTLGVALYRNNQWKEAIDALKESIRLAKSQAFAYDAFFVAMAEFKSGNKAIAHDWFKRGSDWMERNAAEDPELNAFRHEAEQLLDSDSDFPTGLDETPADQPK